MRWTFGSLVLVDEGDADDVVDREVVRVGDIDEEDTACVSLNLVDEDNSCANVDGRRT
jgi:hypothetical protein